MNENKTKKKTHKNCPKKAELRIIEKSTITGVSWGRGGKYGCSFGLESLERSGMIANCCSLYNKRHSQSHRQTWGAGSFPAGIS